MSPEKESVRSRKGLAPVSLYVCTYTPEYIDSPEPYFGAGAGNEIHRASHAKIFKFKANICWQQSNTSDKVCTGYCLRYAKRKKAYNERSCAEVEAF